MIKEETKRQSNIELLRITSMLLIICHHFFVHGNFDFLNSGTFLNEEWAHFWEMGGKIGVNIFVIISGYFSIKSTNTKPSKIIKLWLQIFTYSIGIYIIFALFSGMQIENKDVAKSFFPIIFQNWWFASTYFILYLLIPFINKFLLSLNKKYYKRFLILSFILWSVVPFITGQDNQQNNLIWFVFLYSLAGYIRLYEDDINYSNKAFFLLAFVTVVITCFMICLCDVTGLTYTDFQPIAEHICRLQSPSMLFIALFLFLGFLKTKITYSRIINLIASSTFGIYLIHDNSFIRDFLWNLVFKNRSFSNSQFLIPYSIIVTVIVFVFCGIVELLRIYLLEKNYMKVINKLLLKINKQKIES